MKVVFDKKGREIKEFDILKFCHYSRGKKKYFMYKWVRIIDGELVAMHVDSPNGYVILWTHADNKQTYTTAEILVGHSKFGYGYLFTGER